MTELKTIEVSASTAQVQVYHRGSAAFEFQVGDSRISIELDAELFRKLVYQLAHEVERAASSGAPVPSVGTQP